jgi:hypothetical protein
VSNDTMKNDSSLDTSKTERSFPVRVCRPAAPWVPTRKDGISTTHPPLLQSKFLFLNEPPRDRPAA